MVVVDIVTLRTRLLYVSAMYTLPMTTNKNIQIIKIEYIPSPDESSANPYGPFKTADVAWPLSPLNVPIVPLPTIVVMIPVDTVILRIRLLLLSAMYTLPMRENKK